MIIAWLWLACSSVPEDLASQRDALAAYRRAEAALASGAVDDALRHIDTAIARRPRDPLLVAWRAEVVARQDPLQAADDLEALLAAHPRFGIARYNRAAYLARAGKLFDAGPELQRALAEGAASVEQVRSDEDFAPHLQHPALNFLPLPQLDVSLGRLPERAFRDAEVPVVVRALTDQPVTIEGAVEGPGEVVAVVEDRRGAEQVLTWTLRAVAPGSARVGPLTVRSGGMEQALAEARFEVVGPLDAPQGVDVTTALPLPSDPAFACPMGVAVRGDEAIYVRTDAVSRVTVAPPQPPRWRLELREEGQTKWVTWVYPSTVDTVEVRGASGEVFSGAPRARGVATEH